MKPFKTTLGIAAFIAVMIVLYLAVMASAAQAQTKYNLATAIFEHTWNPKDASDITTEWRYNCGAKSGGYTLVTKVTFAAPISGSLFDVPAKTVFSNIPGIYFCVVKNANAFGESGPTNEVSGDFGNSPSAGTNLVLKP